MPQIGKDGRMYTMRLDRDEVDALLSLLDLSRAWLDKRRRMGAHPLAIMFVREDMELLASLNALEVPLYGAFTASRL